MRPPCTAPLAPPWGASALREQGGGWWKQRGDETSLFGVCKQLCGAERREVITSVQLRAGVFSVRAYEGGRGGLSSSRGLLHGCRSVLLQQASSPHLIPRKCKGKSDGEPRVRCCLGSSVPAGRQRLLADLSFHSACAEQRQGAHSWPPRNPRSQNTP